jgi:hypothetical protein
MEGKCGYVSSSGSDTDQGINDQIFKILQQKEILIFLKNVKAIGEDFISQKRTWMLSDEFWKRLLYCYLEALRDPELLRAGVLHPECTLRIP